jgi:uncharacterized phage-associated protein
MAYKANDIAQYMLSLSNPEVGDMISNLKLQKLLYYVQGFHLAMYNRPAFDEDIYAWQYGPVVPEVYHEYKSSGSAGIPVPEQMEAKLDTNVTDLVKEVYDVYGQYSALKLMDMTHNEAPWQKTPINGIISHELMYNYFKPLVKA